MTMRISDIDVSGTAPPLHLQLGIEEAYVEQEEADLKALHRLRVRGLITPPLAHSACGMVLETAIRRLIGIGILQSTHQPQPNGVSETVNTPAESPTEDELEEETEVTAVGDSE